MRFLRRVAGSRWPRVVVSIILLGLVASRIDIGDVSRRLQQGRWGLFAAGVGVMALALPIAALRWHLFLRAVEVRRRYGSVLRVYLLGAVLTNVLPGSVGGDFARAWFMGPRSRMKGLASVLVDRGSLFACAVLLGWIGVAASGSPLPRSLVVTLAAASAVLLIAATVAGVALNGAGRLAAGSRVGTQADALVTTCKDCLRSVRTIAVCTGLGLAYEALAVMSVWLDARSISVAVPFWLLAVITPPLLILAALPLSLGGLGVREVGYASLLGAAGIGVSDATLLSLLAGASFLLASLPGTGALLGPGRLRESAQSLPQPSVSQPES